jgi:hypothetical protein
MRLAFAPATPRHALQAALVLLRRNVGVSTAFSWRPNKDWGFFEYADNVVVHNEQLDSGTTLVNNPYRRAVLFEKLRAMLDPTAALHALTAGAMGTMMLAVMTRATLGHTGRQLSAGPGTTAIYGLVSLAVLARVLAPLMSDVAPILLGLSGFSWIAAFGLFVALYGPLLVRSRRTG